MMVVFFATLAAVFAQIAVDEASLSPNQRAQLAARRELKSGHLILTFETRTAISNNARNSGELESPSLLYYEVWFNETCNHTHVSSGKTLRPGETDPTPARGIRVIDCQGLEFEYRDLDRIVGHALFPANINHEVKGGGIYSPRLVGISFMNISRGTLEDSLLIFPNRNDVTTASVDYLGTSCVEESFTMPSGDKMRMTYDPELGGSLVNAKYETVYPDGRISSMELSATPKKYADHWFVEEVLVVDKLDGTITREERTIVEQAEFNIDIPPSRFEIAALEMPVGYPVYDSREPREFVWNGTEVVRLSRALVGGAKPTFLQPVRPAWYTNPWLWVGGAISLLAALFFARAIFKNPT